MAAPECCQSHGFTKYEFIQAAVPRLEVSDPEVSRLISEGKPLILTNADLIKPALHWDLTYLTENMGDSKLTVYKSDTDVFKYHDSSRFGETLPDFRPPTERCEMTFSDFGDQLRQWKPGEKRLYLQQGLTTNFGKGIVGDFLKFNWAWAQKIQQENNWGSLTSNLLLIAQPGNVTPCHYDEQQNLFGQIHGVKRFLLFPPEQFPFLYPHPVPHPHDRQSQVDFDCPDYEKFPNFKQACGVEAILHPGDVLYLPMYWWHHVETSPNDDYNISLNFWYKAGPVTKVEYPLEGHQKVAIMRNLEKMLFELLKDPNDVSELFRWLVLGRYVSANAGNP